MPINKTPDQTKRTPQNVFNKSYDQDFDILAVEMLGYDYNAVVLRRVRVTSEGKLRVAV